MKASYKNIVLVCLDGDFNKEICKELAEKLDMFFANLKDYIEYDLISSKEILEKCGIEYLAEREFKATQSFARFENAVLTVDYDLFKQNIKAFSKGSLIVYLRLSKRLIDEKETINKLSFDSRDEFLASKCGLVVSLKSKVKNKAIKEIMLRIGEVV